MALGTRVILIRTLLTLNGVYVYKRKHRWSKNWELVHVYTTDEYYKMNGWKRITNNLQGRM